VSKGSRRGLVRDHKRLPAASQITKLKAAGFDPIYTLDKSVTVDDAVKSFRPGNTAGVARLWVVADPKIGKKKGQRQALYAAVDAIEARGATIEEVDTGRTSKDPKQRDAMIRDAAEAVTTAGRGLKSADNGRRSKGRPAVEFAPEVLERARNIWFDRRVKTWADAAAKLTPLGMSTAKAFKLFGKRNQQE